MTAKARSTPCAHHPRPPSRMRLFVSGGTGVLGRDLRPLAATAGHELVMPTGDELDRFDPAAVVAAA
jgi:dTDP-4-dehydrorhamnose reductase